MNKNILLVIVTYNRLANLQECLKNVKDQTYKEFDILIIDNGSTDSTAEWLKTQSDLNVIHQANTGCAGGFATGFQYAIDKWYSWVWCMDDDGIPTPACLENLIKRKDLLKPTNMLGSLVVDTRNPNLLSFKVPSIDSYNKFLDYYSKLIINPDVVRQESKNGIYEWLMPFNSVLFSAQMIKEIGIPNQALFIRGDEVEYMYRGISKGYKPYIIIDSVFHHPSFINDKATEAKWKLQFEARNTTYVVRRYRKKTYLRLLNRLGKALLTGKLFLIEPIIDGWRGNLSENYLTNQLKK